MTELLNNTQQSIQFDAGMVISTAIPESIRSELYSAYSNLKDDELEQKLQGISAILPDSIKQELSRFGARLPTDKINLNLSLSSFLFDLYTNGVVAPEAPLKKKALEKRVQDLAIHMDKPEFEVPVEFLQPMLDVFGDDEKTKKMIVTAWIDMPEGSDPKQVFTQINWFGAKMFRNVLNAAEDALFPYFQEG